jgi:hypothetical protein
MNCKKSKLLRKFAKDDRHYKKLKKFYTPLSWINKTKLSEHIKAELIMEAF